MAAWGGAELDLGTDVGDAGGVRGPGDGRDRAADAPTASGGTFAARLGVGAALPLALALLLVALILLLGGVYYAIARKNGVTFREAVFNWPMVSTAGGIAVVFLLE